MAIKLTQEHIDNIIKQIEKLQQLAKAGIEEANKEAEPFSLTANEKVELSQLEEYENTKQKIKDEEQHLHPGAPGIAKVSRDLIKLYKANLERTGPSYNAVLSRQLKHKDQEAKRKYEKTLKNYFRESIKPHWDKFEISLYALKPALDLLDYQIVNQLQGLLDLKNCHVASDGQFADVKLKLQKIKARIEFGRQQQPVVQKPTKTGRNTTPAKEEKANLNIEIGDIQAENVQIGYGSVHKQVQTEKKNKGVVKKALKVIVAIIGFLAALLTCLYYLGWLEPIKTFIYNILQLE